MPMDAFRQGDRFEVRLDLPGVDPGSIDLTVEKNALTVAAERRWEAVRGGPQVVAAERPQGTFRRPAVPGRRARPRTGRGESYDNGVLTITIPVAEQAKPRKVEVSAGGAQPAAIETTGANASA